MQEDEAMAPFERAPNGDAAATPVLKAPPRRPVRRRVAAPAADVGAAAVAVAPVATAPISAPVTEAALQATHLPQPTATAQASIPASLQAADPPTQQVLVGGGSDTRHSTDAGQVAAAGSAAGDEGRLEPVTDRSSGRRRRSRRGRHADPVDEGTDRETPGQPTLAIADEDPMLSPEAAAEPRQDDGSERSWAPARAREDGRPSTDPAAYRSNGGGRRDGNDYGSSGDGREPRQDAARERNGRLDTRNRRDWREQPDLREPRDGQRQGQRDRGLPNRERGYVAGRDSRQTGNVPREQGRDGLPYRDPRDSGGYREPAGYRDGAGPAPLRDRGPEAAPAPRPTEVVTRGYVVAIDQNQTQWQLRTHGHLPSPQDASISVAVVRANGLRMGDEVVGLVRGAAPGRRFGELLDVQSINGIPIDRVTSRPRFDDLTPIYPDRHMRLERPDSITARIIDIVCPVGFGQRAMIVSPPKAGKTTILKEIGRSININYPEVKLIVCLVGERPEEVTDLAKSLQGEVISSTFDEAINHHTELAEITIERARRLVESGFDVVVLLDSVTRLARAYNLSAPGDSRSLSGGMATTALYPPKRFFGAARALEEGGSLTVLATCLVDTNSRLDDVIYEELKGTGNMELVLDRRLAEERVFPAIDIVKSSTRREELLLQPNELTAVTRLRRALTMGNDQVNNTQRIVQQMERTRTNAEFLASLLTQSSAR